MPTLRATAGLLLPGVACGAVGGLAGVGLMAAHDLWDLAPAAQNLTDATVGVSYSLIAAVVLLAGRLNDGARSLATVLLVAGAASGLTAWTTAVAMGATQETGWVRLAVQLQSFLWVPGFLPLLTLVPLLHPSGLLPGRRWRAVAVAAVVGMLLLAVGAGLFPETFEGRIRLERPVTAEPVARVAFTAGALVLVPTVVASLASLGVRLRRTRGLERRQVVVLLVAAGALAVVTALQGVLPSPVDVLLQAGAAALVPLAIGVAVTRHRLYELDIAVCRALALASLAVCLAGAYLTVFAVLQGLPGHASAVSAALAAGTSGALVQPLGRRLARGVDRLYYGERAEPWVVATRMSQALAGVGLDVDRVPGTVCRTVVKALRLPRAELRLDDLSLAVAGEGTGPTEEFDLRHHGETVARLVATARPGERELADSDRSVLQGLADQVAPAVAALRLHHELQRSRELLVAARETERRQLRRDLHDGLGASLAGLRLQLETAADLVEQPTASDLLDRAAGTVTQAVAEVRSLCDGLRPPGIDDLGLARTLAALAERTRTPALDVRLDVPQDLAGLPPAVEVAVHRIAAEALANAARHSGARCVDVRLTAGDTLDLVVADDGHGVLTGAATSGGGLGLDSMRLRAEEIGGRLEVRSDHTGTRVTARLPLTPGGAR
ncbi:histidine kinase [Nocardioides marmoribigeumensis]|uniref:Signal transduction histidine kinase n=1 Tax=Nocardioides marmoribigeumensis TaxID=433649 RepID=A0ABU2BYF1_9ACTN|nr:histidine kinase [Nocardioides marmoribigeumensis]MDR7363419.1 signal transduction histidine kinase [Nocardioides marmoribigeumensis]